MYHSHNEPVTLARDCPAVLIPAGEKVTLPEGTTGFLTQALGGSFTIYIEGNLFRIAGRDGDAIGKPPMLGPELPEDATEADLEAVVWQQLRTCYDPEIPINIVELGLVYECKVERVESGGRVVSIKMTLTAPGCGMGDILAQDVREKIEQIPTVERAEVEVVFDPPWNRSMMSEEARLEAGLF
ncbi:MAG TPA: putative Fe-S cluster assembly protein SufT [Gammaproteobacteria bacterium]|jgi:probable FeS assembly SUF system protein SufT|nr:putative Fe-S cluster assembly protein SufT [Gammaproteobacteria bacterium]